jgi:hypothetical protein
MTLIEFLAARLDEDASNLPSGFDCWYEPERYEREVEVKRAVLEWHAASDYCCDTFDVDLCPTVLALAAVYSHHPDYRPEWRPEEPARG